MMGEARLVTVSEHPQSETAIIFVHGFGGDAEATWGEFPRLLKNQATGLSDWSIYSLGYSSQLMPDLRGIWSGDPGIETLANYLDSRAAQHPLSRYKALALIAHSMGGLVVQKALVDYARLQKRVSHVLLYGTPSRGLKKSNGFLGRLFKRQTEDMGLNSTFVPALRKSWQENFGDREQPLPHGQVRPFGFWAIAGDRDEFVPASSSLDPFDKEDRVVVPGNHLEIVKPDDFTSMSVQAAVDAIVGEASPGGPWNAARVAVEMGDFHQAIARLEPNAGALDEPSTVYLALALDRVGRRDAAVRVLEQRRARGGTDAMGTLAGRFKRIWWAEGLEDSARQALELYQSAYDLSVAADDHDQAFYHGINVAFMKLAFERDSDSAKEMARKVLDHCANARQLDAWCLATKAEAYFYLSEPSAGLAAYEEAVATNPEPWQMKSMFTQALHVMDALDDQISAAALKQIFRSVADEDAY